jgi:DNA-binding NtrC family response regulator
VRRILKRIIEDNKYKVMGAVNGTETLRLFMEHRDEIDMVLLDIIMPDKGGGEVYEEIRQVSPKTKVLFISGYIGEGLLKDRIAEEGLNYIPKPVEPDELHIKIRDMLDK